MADTKRIDGWMDEKDRPSLRLSQIASKMKVSTPVTVRCTNTIRDMSEKNQMAGMHAIPTASAMGKRRMANIIKIMIYAVSFTADG